MTAFRRGYAFAVKAGTLSNLSLNWWQPTLHSGPARDGAFDSLVLAGCGARNALASPCLSGSHALTHDSPPLKLPTILERKPTPAQLSSGALSASSRRQSFA